MIQRDAYGDYSEVHQPLGGTDTDDHPISLPYQGATVPKKMNKLGLAGRPAHGSLFRPDPPEQDVALKDAKEEADHKETRAMTGIPDAGTPRDERT